MAENSRSERPAGERILVVGGTGGAGLQVIRQAVGRGFDVVAVVRSAAKLGDLAGSIDVITGDITDPAVLGRAAAGCRAVLSSIGAPAGFLGRGATTIYSSTATALVTALPAAHVDRLVFCSSAEVEAHDPEELLPYRLIAKPLFLQRGYDDMTAAEKIIIGSDLDWILVRPARLTDTTATNHYRVSPRFRPHKGNRHLPARPRLVHARPGQRPDLGTRHADAGLLSRVSAADPPAPVGPAG